MHHVRVADLRAARDLARHFHFGATVPETPENEMAGSAAPDVVRIFSDHYRRRVVRETCIARKEMLMRAAAYALGTAALEILTIAGGNISYSGAGAVLTNGFGTDALFAATPAGGSINITSTGAFIATGAGSGINAASTGGGTTIDLTGGTLGVVGVGGSGISAVDTAGGSVSVTTGDQQVIGGTGSGILAASPGGGSVTVTTGSVLVQGLGRTTSIEQIQNIVIQATGGVPVRLGDIGEVVIGSEIRRGAVTADG